MLELLGVVSRRMSVTESVSAAEPRGGVCVCKAGNGNIFLLLVYPSLCVCVYFLLHSALA